ncbi:MAG: radical SAM protein, partial [Candidatus Pacearchaeota archaeon]|nr:radical SAM protein [Candidatus Pacearchaeota archaeon]
VIPLIRKYNIKFVCITGGEPTLHPELDKIIKLIKKKGIFVTLITNCIGLSKHFNKIKGYIDGYMISLDADTPTLLYKIRGNKNFLEVNSWPKKIKRESPLLKLCFLV